MNLCRLALVFLSLLVLAPTRAVAAPASAPAGSTPLLPDTTLDSLAGSLRGFLIEYLPTPLYTTTKNWGNTRPVANGVKWKGKGLKVHAEVMKAPKNDGIWTRLTLTSPNLRNSLILDLRNLRAAPQGPATFDAFVAFDVTAEYERQSWMSGARLYSGSTRLRFRVKLAMQCEVTSRLEKHDGAMPDLVFRMRVVKANLSYDNLVFEHVAGLGGEAAKLIGEAVKGGLHRFHPGLEREMLAKAEAAVVKAADTKEVRVSLARVLPR
jgi:hypothetical protein